MSMSMSMPTDEPAKESLSPVDAAIGDEAGEHGLAAYAPIVPITMRLQAG